MLKKRILIIISYIMASIWGLVILYDLIVFPYDVSRVDDFILSFFIVVVATIMLGPLGLVYMIDRHYKNKEKKDEILKR